MAAIGMGAATAVVTALTLTRLPPWPQLLLCLVVLGAGVFSKFVYNIGGKQFSSDFLGTACIAVLPIAGAEPSLAGFVWILAVFKFRLQGQEWVRATFNAGGCAVGTLPTALVALVAKPGSNEGTFLGLVFLASLVSEFLVASIVSSAISYTTTSSWRESLESQVRDSSAHAVLAGIAGVTIALAIDHPVMWPLPVGCVAAFSGFLWFRAHSVTQIGALQQLTKAAAPVGAHDPHRALEELAYRGIDLFSCDGVQLVVTSPSGDGWWICTASASGPADLRHVEQEPELLSEESTVVAPLSTADRELGRVSLIFHSRPKLHRDAKNVLHLFAQAASAAWSMVVAHQELMAEERERQAETQRRLHAQTHEPLTGLPNRTQLDTWVDGALAANRTVSLVLVTLSKFREVNEILGHQSGDTLLREVAFRLRGSVRSNDVVSRVDGAHFCVALFDVPGTHVTRVASDIQTRVGQPMSIDGLTIAVELTIGVAHGPADASSADGLLRCAEVATGMAQREGVSTLTYDPSQEQGSVDDLQLMTELADAVQRDELVLHYQPKVDLTTGRVTGAEALVRWQHPLRGLLSPAAFVDHLERSALLIPVTLHLVERALIDLRGWPEHEDTDPYTVAVNLGARCLLDGGLPDALERLCLRHGVPTSRVVLEITESVAVSPLPIAAQVLDGLRERGFTLSVDDFGTGFSSLTFLHRHKVSELKIDRSFVSQVATEESARAIVGAAVALAHDLGMKAVAEGVETPEQLAALMGLKVDLAQGYLMAKPMAPHALEGHLASTPVDPHVIDATVEAIAATNVA